VKHNILPFSMHEWVDQWIKTAGANECSCEFDPELFDKEKILKIN